LENKPSADFEGASDKLERIISELSEILHTYQGINLQSITNVKAESNDETSSIELADINRVRYSKPTFIQKFIYTKRRITSQEILATIHVMFHVRHYFSEKASIQFFKQNGNFYYDTFYRYKNRNTLLLNGIDKDLFSSSSLEFFDKYDVSFLRVMLHGEMREFLMRSDLDDINERDYKPLLSMDSNLIEIVAKYLFGNHISQSVITQITTRYNTINNESYVDYFNQHYDNIGIYDQFNGDPINYASSIIEDVPTI